MAIRPFSNDSTCFSRTRAALSMYLAVLVCAAPSLALGQDATGTIEATCGFATGIQQVLNAISIVVVTIAIVFAGYQIAFAHKRISDVAPVLIGAILIGAAGQIAKMFLSSSAEGGCASVVAQYFIQYV